MSHWLSKPRIARQLAIEKKLRKFSNQHDQSIKRSIITILGWHIVAHFAQCTYTDVLAEQLIQHRHHCCSLQYLLVTRGTKQKQSSHEKHATVLNPLLVLRASRDSTQNISWRISHNVRTEAEPQMPTQAHRGKIRRHC